MYDAMSRDAALIDVGGPIEVLLARVREEHLHVRFILVTHGHIDHILGVRAIRDCFPEARVCMHEDDFTDLQTVQQWADENLPEELVAKMRADPELRKIVEFDASHFERPGRFLEDGDVLQVGSHAVRVLHCPGHSRGGLCYAVGDFLFSGDVLFQGTVGRVDLQNSSRADQIGSVRRLYREFPDGTIVHPGHGDSTTIGEERVGNARVSETAVDL
jgi:glyoxylase-like metal-dependent hydrolase (beta-lactamase superfamily II)